MNDPTEQDTMETPTTAENPTEAANVSTAAEAQESAAEPVVPWDDLGPKIIEAIQTIYDPEIPVNIYELGLIYSVSPTDEDGHIDVKMTLTSPHCPVAESLPGEVRMTVEGVEGVQAAKVDVVWDPPWNPDMMSEAAKLELGMF